MTKKKAENSLRGIVAESQNAENEAIAAEKQTSGRGRPAKAEPTITMSIRITEDRRQKLKVYSAMHGTTISDLIADFADSLEA